MSWTKRQLLEQAYCELGMPRYTFDIEPEDIALAINRMDTMIAGWAVKGIRLGYPISQTPTDYDPDQDSNLPEHALSAVYSNLALRIAPTIGKTVSQETKNNARASYLSLIAQTSQIPEMQFDKTLPKGAGNKPTRGRNREFFRVNSSLDTNTDGNLDF